MPYGCTGSVQRNEHAVRNTECPTYNCQRERNTHVRRTQHQTTSLIGQEEQELQLTCPTWSSFPCIAPPCLKNAKTFGHCDGKRFRCRGLRRLSVCQRGLELFFQNSAQFQHRLRIFRGQRYDCKESHSKLSGKQGACLDPKLRVGGQLAALPQVLKDRDAAPAGADRALGPDRALNPDRLPTNPTVPANAGWSAFFRSANLAYPPYLSQTRDSPVKRPTGWKPPLGLLRISMRSECCAIGMSPSAPAACRILGEKHSVSFVQQKTKAISDRGDRLERNRSGSDALVGNGQERENLGCRGDQPLARLALPQLLPCVLKRVHDFVLISGQRPPRL